MEKTIALFASARKNGNTRKFIDWIACELNIDVVDLTLMNITPYDYEHRNIDDDFIPLIERLIDYKNIILASPVYWYSVSTQMKVFIDRTSDLLDIDELKDLGRSLRGKNAYVVCSSVSKNADSAFVSALEKTFGYLGMNYGGHVHANCENGYEPKHYQQSVCEFVQLVNNSGVCNFKLGLEYTGKY